MKAIATATVIAALTLGLQGCSSYTQFANQAAFVSEPITTKSGSQVRFTYANDFLKYWSNEYKTESQVLEERISKDLGYKRLCKEGWDFIKTVKINSTHSQTYIECK